MGDACGLALFLLRWAVRDGTKAARRKWDLCHYWWTCFFCVVCVCVADHRPSSIVKPIYTTAYACVARVLLRLNPLELSGRSQKSAPPVQPSGSVVIGGLVLLGVWLIDCLRRQPDLYHTARVSAGFQPVERRGCCS